MATQTHPKRDCDAVFWCILLMNYDEKSHSTIIQALWLMDIDGYFRFCKNQVESRSSPYSAPQKKPAEAALIGIS